MSFLEKHYTYLNVVRYVAFVPALIWAIFTYLHLAMYMAGTGNTLWFVLTLVFFEVVIFLCTMFAWIIWAFWVLLFSALPYLAIRGLVSR